MIRHQGDLLAAYKMFTSRPDLPPVARKTFRLPTDDQRRPTDLALFVARVAPMQNRQPADLVSMNSLSADREKTENNRPSVTTPSRQATS